MRFQDKVCLVTGGGSGIGRAACERFVTEGGRVVVVDLNDEHGADAVKAIVASGGHAIFAKANVAKEDEVKSSIQAALDKWSRLDVVVNCAAMMTFKNIVDLSVEEWDRVQAVNLRSVFLYCHYALPHMNRGAIVNISSVHAHETDAERRSIRRFQRRHGSVYARLQLRNSRRAKYRINCVAPGAVNTPMLWNNPNVKSGAEKITGRHRQAAMTLLPRSASWPPREARFITGTTLVVGRGTAGHSVSRAMGEFMFATGIENSYPTIELANGKTHRVRTRWRRPATTIVGATISICPTSSASLTCATARPITRPTRPGQVRLELRGRNVE